MPGKKPTPDLFSPVDAEASADVLPLVPKVKKRAAPKKAAPDIKDMILEALVAAGGVSYLVEQAHEIPVTFLGLVAKVLPHQVKDAPEADDGVTVNIKRF
ncbi:MAG: hypothetical protein JO002_04460 [Burkholderiaceae bacterium]|nr:hypothetical protein [Burkholderiaceae bacterium]